MAGHELPEQLIEFQTHLEGRELLVGQAKEEAKEEPKPEEPPKEQPKPEEPPKEEPKKDEAKKDEGKK